MYNCHLFSADTSGPVEKSWRISNLFAQKGYLLELKTCLTDLNFIVRFPYVSR